MESARAAQLQALLEGVAFPAAKAELLEHAVRQRAEPPFIDILRRIPDREYVGLEAVGREVARVQSRAGLT